MDDNKKVISNGWRVGSQTPIDDRLIFNTFAELIDLGASNFEAFRYYEGMKVYVVETEQEYVWKESSTGALVSSITYPANIIANGIDYSGRSFNFVEASHSPSLTYVDVETTADLAGSFGGNIISSPSVDVFPTLQGVSPVLGMRVLVKDQSSQLQNGDYVLTRVGDGATEGWILTRISDKTDEFYFRLWKVESTGRIYEQITELPAVNTDSIIFKDLKYLNLGNILYVSENGDDSLAQKGNINYPYATLYAAKTAAVSGDLIYVFAQTIEYDNRNASGNQWNGRQAEINLWKNGITYYFEPNSKIIFRNETSAGQRLYLFSGDGISGETCSLYGYLEVEIYGYGANTSNGQSHFLYSAAGTDGGYNFNAQLKRLYSDHSEPISVVKSNTISTTININLEIQEEVWRYSAGNTSAGGFYFLMGSGTDSELNFKADCRIRDYNYASPGLLGYPFYLRGTFSDTSKINIKGDKCSNLTKTLIRLREVKHKNININIDQIYFDYYTATNSNGVITEVYDPSSLSDYVLNITGDLIEAYANAYAANIFEIIGPNSKIYYKGNIYLKNNGGAGKSIVYCANGASGTGYCSNNDININANIYLIGTSSQTAVLFKSFGTNNKVNFSGNITGIFEKLAHCANDSEVNIVNSYIKSSASNFRLGENNTTSFSRLKINNSHIYASDATSFGDLNYLTTHIINSYIVNTGAGIGLYNTTGNGNLQVLNSIIYTGTGESINYASGLVICDNTTVKNTYTISDLRGSISILTDLFI